MRLSCVEIIELIDELLPAGGPYADVLEKFRSFMEFQAGAREKATPPHIETASPDEPGKSLIGENASVVDFQSAARHAMEIADFFSGTNPDQWRTTADAIAVGRLDAVRTAKSFLFGEDESETAENIGELNLPAPLVLSLVQLSLKPQLLMISEAYLESVEKPAHRPDCPVCGSPPTIADRTGGASIMVLHCPVCEASWNFTFGRCPHCLTDSSEDVELILAEDAPVGIQACKKCRGYVKFIDRAAESDFPPFPLSDVLTMYLDYVAEKRGYERTAPGVFGF